MYLPAALLLNFLSGGDPVKTTPMAATLAVVDTHPGAFVGSALAAHGGVLLTAASYTIGDIVKPAPAWGRVYVYELGDDAWRATTPLPRPGPESLRFGYSLGFDGTRAIVGSLSDIARPYDFRGIAHIYLRTPQGWKLEQPLEDAQAWTVGWAVAINGDTAAVSAVNRGDPVVLVYRLTQGRWSLEQRIARPRSGAKDFGHALALDGETLAIAARGEDAGATDSGAVYVFGRKDRTWSEEARLTSPKPEVGDLLGNSLSLANGVLLAGAPQFNREGAAGKAVVYRQIGAEWVTDAELSAPDAAPRDWFGTSVALADDVAAIGAYGDDGPNGPTGRGSGACYVFRRVHGQWDLDAKYGAPTPSDHTSFGFRVCVSRGWLFVASADTPESSGPPTPSNGVRAARIFSQPIGQPTSPARVP
jgi:hypothetical protein